MVTRESVEMKGLGFPVRTRRCIVAGAIAVLALSAAAANAQTVPMRTFEFSYQVHFPAAPGVQGAAELWIPAPVLHDGQQEVIANGSGILDSRVLVTSAVEHDTGVDPEYHNRFFVFHPTAQQLAAGFDVTVQFTVTRKEYVVLHDGVLVRASAGRAAEPAELKRYSQPDKLVPIDGVIAQLAKEQTAGATTPLEKARRIYNYVVSTMHYDKSGEGWGRGDAIWACDSKRGNCTDFHSLFIGMMRASGIPARFEIGFPVPEDKSEGAISGYHCWAEFYIDGIGWIPVDASEASKNPAKKEYFFGALDADRVLFTYGRDLRLSAEQHGPPLNYFIYPYAEIAGQPVKDLQSHFYFRELGAAAQTQAGR